MNNELLISIVNPVIYVPIIYVLIKHYNCRVITTNVMISLQINLFMQNKAKFQKVKFYVNKEMAREYEKKDTWWSGKKQSQTNPNKAKFKKAKMSVTSIIIRGYENKPPIRAPKKQSQIPKRQKPMQPLLPQGIMKKTALSASDKTKPNKANQTQLKPIFSGPLKNILKKRIFYLTYIHRTAMYSNYWYSILEIQNWLFQKI